jgi:cytochrome c peroxidase
LDATRISGYDSRKGGDRLLRGTRIAGAILALAALAQAQGGRSYGPGRIWWDAGTGDIFPWEGTYDNSEGQVTIVNRDAAVRTKGHAFFEPLGRNGRACVTCHQPANAMSLSADTIRERWREAGDQDPLFAAIDGSNCPNLPQHEMSSHSLLLDRGVFRIALPWPPKVKPEFRIEIVRDPTGCNTSPVYGIQSANAAVSVYRRPRVAANLDYVVAGPSGTTFMADGRELSLQGQAASAILVHEQAERPATDGQLHQIVDFETRVYAAQSADIRGGLLDETDGPLVLGPQNLVSGRARNLSAESQSPVLRSFDAWRKHSSDRDLGFQREFRASVARGSDVFYTRKFRLESGGAAKGTCTTCHASGITRWMDISTTNRAGAQSLPDLPLFRITCDDRALPHPVLGRVIYTQDPGRALISGKCADVGSIAIQQLRGLAARAPYFSNGSARDLREVVEFYERRFQIGYTEEERKDLINFLRVL